MRPTIFWVTSLVAALGFTAVVAVLFPYGPLGLDSLADRQRAWLLTTWTSGVLAICFGATGLLSDFTALGFRDVAEVGSVTAALDARREQRERKGPHAFYNFAGWTVSMGGWLILVYFVGWVVLGR